MYLKKEINPENQKLLDRYLMSCKNKGLSPMTIKGFTYDLKLLLKFIGDKELKDITHHDIENFFYHCLTERKNQSQALARKYTSINVFIETLIRKELIDDPAFKNPMHKVDQIKIIRNTKDYLTENEIEMVFNYLKDKNDFRNLAMMSLMYSSACRISEIYQLDITDLDMKNRKFRIIGKGRKPRTCFFSEETKQHILRYLETRNDEFEYLFLSRENNRLSRRAMQNAVVNIIKEVGIKKHITPHSFRHSILTNMRRQGMPLEDLQLLAGHSNISTTQQSYTHVDLEDVVDKFDNFHNRKRVN